MSIELHSKTLRHLTDGTLIEAELETKAALDAAKAATELKDLQWHHRADGNINFEKWQWQQGVALFGLIKSYQTLGEVRYLDFVNEWVDHQLALQKKEGEVAKSINTAAPILAISHLADFRPNPKYDAVCEDFAKWCITSAPRLPDGTFEHTCPAASFTQQAWADTLFMGCIFLAKWGKKTGQKHLVEEAVKQFIQHYKLLGDPATGLIYHGYNDLEKKNIGIIWGRGNGWFSVASAELLKILDPSDEGRDQILSNLKKHTAGVLSTQDSSGAWHTVMTAPETYLESTSTAAFAYGLAHAKALGFSTKEIEECREKALSFLVGAIDERGRLTKASGGTPIWPDTAAYNVIPYAFTPFAQGLGMLAFATTGK
jgi:unsaturated rhamnogalacturonyl hydrolase